MRTHHDSASTDTGTHAPALSPNEQACQTAQWPLAAVQWTACCTRSAANGGKTARPTTDCGNGTPTVSNVFVICSYVSSNVVNMMNITQHALILNQPTRQQALCSCTVNRGWSWSHAGMTSDRAQAAVWAENGTAQCCSRMRSLPADLHDRWCQCPRVLPATNKCIKYNCMHNKYISN